ncbi:transcriptional regulator BetI [Celeribacter neptunius]|uniref:HTH-type transcriptional regulator BetI n=1 Tax=Celeribacter neptunius TaxID=588602 RepID=A0A1I3R3D6_9RHOB|nr:transcriptional regulator, TetR family [Celeribacter neptunius]
MAGKSRKSEEERRAELIAATIREIGATGSLDVTTSQIAKRAGVSPALAFHYFHDKEGLFLAAMRAILTEYGADVRVALKGKATPDERLQAIVHASFGMASFRREAISAWVNFYALALRSAPARRLLYLYQRRLHSNLVNALRPKIQNRAPDVARRIAGLIDGLYLRYALDAKALHSTDEAVGVIDGSEGAHHVLHAIAAECSEAQENDDISLTKRDPDPITPLASPQK